MNRDNGMTAKNTMVKWLHTGSLAGIAVASLAIISGQPISAQEDTDGKVAVGGKTVLTIRVPSEGMTIHQRAEAIQNRLVTILNDSDLKPSDIFAAPLGKNAAKIMVKNQLLVTIDPQTARINQAKPMALAQIWVTHLRHVLPQVSVKPNPNSGEPKNNNEKSNAGDTGNSTR